MMRKCKRIVPALLALCLSMLLILQASGTALDEAAAVAASVRKKMIARETEIAFTVTVPTSLLTDGDAFHEYMNDYFVEVNRLVILHDGTLKGGDFLHKHIGRYGYNVPEFSFYPGSETTDVSGWFSYTYYTTAAQEKELDDAVEKTLKELALDGSSDLDKLKAVYGYITSNVTYDFANLNDDSYDLKYSAYAAQVNGTAVCQGYANLFYLYMQLVGIDCRIITGESIGTNGTWEGHAWNIVKLGDLYYNCDATWDAGGVDTPQYFLRGTTDFPNHVSDDEFLTEAFTTAYPIAETRYDIYSHTHTPVTVPGYAATCTAPGLTDGVICSVCNAVLTEQTEIPALGHDTVDHEGKAPTCTEKGWNAYQTCSRCDYNTFEELDALGHDLIDHPAQTPTCSKIGWNAYQTCSRCEYTTYEELSPTGHAYGAPIYTWSEDNTEATAKVVCANDKSHEISETVKTTSETKKATCTEPEKIIYFAAFTNKMFYGQQKEVVVGSPLGHDYVDHEGKEPTCTEIGWNAYRTCSRCNDSTYEELDALGHDLIAHPAQAPTCSEIGWNAYQTCSRCKYTTYKELPQDPDAHVFNITVVPPTCTDDGYTSYACRYCRYGYSDNIVPAAGHAYGEPIYEWSEDLSEATAKVVCANDESHVIAETVKTASQTKKPTCTESGATVYTAAFNNKRFYGQQKVVEIPAIGHDYVDREGKSPTCTEPGWSAYQTCSRCDYSSFAELPAAGHAWGKWENLNETLHKRVCANDPAHIEEAEHVWDQGEITKPATPTAEGEKTFTCMVCGAVRTETLARLPEEKPAFTPGDLDGDGKVSAADARLALRASVKLESFWNDPASPVFLAADADGDGKITAADARKILRVSVKLETFA